MPTLNQISDTLRLMQRDEAICAHFDVYSEEGYSKAYEVFSKLSPKQYSMFKIKRGLRQYRDKDGYPGIFTLLKQWGIIVTDKQETY